MEVKKNDIFTVTITDTGNDGEGIGRVSVPDGKAACAADAAQADTLSADTLPVDTLPAGTLSADTLPVDKLPAAGPDAAGMDVAGAGGFTLFIKDAVIGDTVQAKVMKAKKHYAYAKLEKVIEPSPFRVTPLCPFSRQCGGCQLQALSYEKQLEFKEKKIRNNLIRIGGLSPEQVEEIMEPIIGMDDPWHYRNKAQFPFGTDKDGNVVTGFYAGRTHTIIPNTDCALGVPENRLVLETILSHMKRFHITAYDEQTGTGLLRHVLIRKGFQSGQLMVCLVINGSRFPEEEALADALWQLPGMTSLSVNTNRERTNVILGKKIRVVRGTGFIEDSIGGVTFRISPLSFYQVNPVQTEKLYSQALAYAGLTGTETVWDLYCGIGTISLFLAKQAGKVYGVEIVPDAVRDAQQNARLNGITNAEFFVGKAEEVLPEKYEKEGIHADVIVVDPPRKGCDERCLETMVKMQPERIVYVSCDSATLARDVKWLRERGYEIVRGRGCDMFGGTVHCETVCLLSKLKSTHHIEIELNMDELDLTAAEKKATYQEIKDYVLEKSGLKVSSLYIAQIKQKCGIIERENYNKPKSEEAKQPQCPPEKGKAIKGALKHFGMI